MLTLHSYYKQHSVFTNPGIFSPLFDGLPNNIIDLINVIQGLLVHRIDAYIVDFDIPEERLGEMEIRTILRMTARLMELNDAPLTQERAQEAKLVSSSRDFALFLCACLRHKNIPARIRIGFADYLLGGIQDHVLTEYWDKSSEKWLLADCRLSPEYVKKIARTQDINILNITEPHFYLSGKIWKKCRTGEMDPNHYGYGLVRSIKGMRHIQDRMIFDLAALNKMEVLPWDLWGYMIHDLPGVAPHETEHLALLGLLANITTNESNQLSLLKEIYHHPKFKISNPIISASPIHGKYQLSFQELVQ